VFVVRTMPQLEEAVRENAREVMVVGRLAPAMLEMKDLSSASGKREFTIDFSFANLFEKYNISAIRDSSENVIAVLSQRDILSTP